MAGPGVGDDIASRLGGVLSVDQELPPYNTVGGGKQDLSLLSPRDTRKSQRTRSATAQLKRVACLENNAAGRQQTATAIQSVGEPQDTLVLSPVCNDGLTSAMGGGRRPLLHKSYSVACDVDMHQHGCHGPSSRLPRMLTASVLSDYDASSFFSPTLTVRKSSSVSSLPGADEIKDGVSNRLQPLLSETAVRILRRSESVGFEPGYEQTTPRQHQDQSPKLTKQRRMMGTKGRCPTVDSHAEGGVPWRSADSGSDQCVCGHTKKEIPLGCHVTPSSPVHRQINRRRSYQETNASGSRQRASTASDGDTRGRSVDREAGRSDRDDSGSNTADSDDSSTTAATPSSPKEQRMDIDSFDPYRIFEVQHLPCMILTVHIIRGRNITNGWMQDMIDTPDPYVLLRMKTAPEGRQRSRTIDNNCNPVWDEKFNFYLSLSETNVLEITLMEANMFSLDQNMGTVFFNVENVKEFGRWQTEVFNFNGASEVEISFYLDWDQKPTLRYSLCLSDREKDFMKKRKEQVFEGLKKFLGDQGPKTLDEVPNIAVIGSGGGFRAMTGYSGAFKALGDSGLLDCTMYACGLSGSSWYLSTLYSHPRWPDMNPGDLQNELKHNIDKSLLRLCNSVFRYMGNILAKRRKGQPISFTDFFGHMVGETLLKGRLDSRLTDQREKIRDARVPMPLYTCVHVKKDVPERSFQEWVEFSPYEIGMPKYGTFMDSELFGSKFFMGKLVRKYEEQPLHFLQGIWGSAFCILFKRLLEDNRRLDPVEMIRLEMTKELEKEQDQNDNDDLSDESENEDDIEACDDDGDNEDSQEKMMFIDLASDEGSDDSTTASLDSSDASNDDQVNTVNVAPLGESIQGVDKVDTCSPPPCEEDSGLEGHLGGPTPTSPEGQKKGVRFSEGVDLLEECKARRQERAGDRPLFQKRQQQPALKRMTSQRQGKSRSYWSEILRGIFENKNFELLSTRAGRAAVIHNFMRGLSLQQTYPLSPFTPLNERVQEGDEFDAIFEMHPTNVKQIYMVDAGLTFNSPFPLVLRPQRDIDVILSFDFSARPSDNTPPFKELLLAEKWARLNRLPFPPIDPDVVNSNELKEMYVFKHPTDPHCPIVLHFPLVNSNFRHYKGPGVPRESKDEFSFADFSIFDDPSTPYSTFNFTYTHIQFERLAKLTEFNTLNNLATIRQVLAEAVATKRDSPRRISLNSRDIKLIRMKSVQEKRKIRKFLRKMESRSQTRTPSHSPSTPPSAFFTPLTSDPASKRNPFVFNVKNSSNSSDSADSVENPFFKTSQEGHECLPRPRSDTQRQRNGGTTQLLSESEDAVSCSSRPSVLLDSPDGVFLPSSPHYPKTPHVGPPAQPSKASFHVTQRDPEVLENNHRGSQREDVYDNSEGEPESEDPEEFHDAPEAFTRKGVPVIDPVAAKMHYPETQRRRRLLRRQSTITSLNSITESISLDSNHPTEDRSRQSSETSMECLEHPESISVSDLSEFEGIEDDAIVTNDDDHQLQTQTGQHENGR